MLARWTVGGSAASAAPLGWHSQADDAELRLVALAGQFFGVGVIAEPSGALRARPDLPRLALPTVPNASRPLVRRCLEQAREPSARGDLLRLLERRGWSAHPGDWMPGSGDADAPALYAPWRDWVAAVEVAGSGPAALSADNWEDWGPAARRVAFDELRRRDPAAARDLLAAKLAGLLAAERVRLVELLGVDLSEADAPLLESLASDRAARVKALAAQFLARLGRGGVAADAAELAEFFEVATRGLFRRTRVLAPQPLKTHAQVSRRTALLASVDLASFAGALGLAPAELAALWPWGATGSPDVPFADMIERSGPDDAVAAALEGALAAVPLPVDALASLAPRLSGAGVARVAERLLDAAPNGLALAVDLTRARLDFDRVLGSAAAELLFAALARPEVERDEYEQELRALGLLASRTAARGALDLAARTDLAAADPRLATLRLNAALGASGGTPFLDHDGVRR